MLTRDWNVSNPAAELHADALVWDMTLPIITPGRADHKAGLFAQLRRCGFDCVSITLAVDGMDFAFTIQSLINERRFAQSQPDICALVESAEDVLRVRQSAKLSVAFHFQGTAPFEEDLGYVDVFYKLGVRHALMAYNQRNRVGCGCHVDADTGLTDFGRSLIREMNRVGMIVDCAHTGYRTAMETIAASTSPVIISHTNARTLNDHPRCVPDDEIRACAGSGGVLGITGLSAMLGGDGATPQRLVDHIDHVATLVGPEHVGLALDYVYDLETFSDFVAAHPEMYPASGNYVDMQQLSHEDGPRITQELLRRGYRESEIRGILGENWLRVCRAVWK